MISTESIQSIWEYEVRSEYQSEFLKMYSPNGDWSMLFRKCPGYIKTELKQNREHPNKFITIDYWQSHKLFYAMKENIGKEYERLDKHCEKYTLSENHIGIFEEVIN